MSATLAQIAANRANAQHSTGPRAPEGVAASKLNALKFGLTAKEIVIKGEDPAAYQELRLSFIAAFAPANELEAMMTERACQNWWKLLRAERTEKILTDQLGDNRFLDDGAAKKWNNFMRYRNAVDKAWRHAIAELKLLIALRQKKAAAQADSAAFLAFIGDRVEESKRQQEQDLARIGSVLKMAKDVSNSAPTDAFGKGATATV